LNVLSGGQNVIEDAKSQNDAPLETSIPTGEASLESILCHGSQHEGPSLQRRTNAQLGSVGILLIVLLLTSAGCSRNAKHTVEPKISFTQVPQWNPGDRNLNDVMEGTVSGEQPGQRMVIYSKAGKLWWLQPLLTSPFTTILPDHVWRNETHLGTDYAVLLVDRSYQPAAVLDQLPKRGPGLAAVAIAHGPEKSSSFFVDFSGFTWRVRWKPSDRGGTVNPYNPENVYTDKAGALHLRILNRDGQWTCSEVNLTHSLGYGTYSFTVEDTSGLDPSVVFGMFTWDYSTDLENHREFDIDISRWGDPDNKNAEFVLQPNFVPANISRFSIPAGKLKHTFVWEPGRITMETSRLSGPVDSSLVFKRVFTSEIPTPGSESVRMTFYLYRKPTGNSWALQHPAEVVVDRFEYLP
jgi:hypothetical protein